MGFLELTGRAGRSQLGLGLLSTAGVLCCVQAPLEIIAGSTCALSCFLSLLSQFKGSTNLFVYGFIADEWRLYNRDRCSPRY